MSRFIRFNPLVLLGILALVIAAGCDSGKSNSAKPTPASQETAKTAEPTTTEPPKTEATEPQSSKDLADLELTSLSVPNAVKRNQKFNLTANVRNRGPEAMRVANVVVRATISHATGTGDVHVGTATFRDLAPGQSMAVPISGSVSFGAPGMMKVYARIEGPLHEDRNGANDRREKQVVLN